MFINTKTIKTQEQISFVWYHRFVLKNVYHLLEIFVIINTKKWFLSTNFFHMVSGVSYAFYGAYKDLNKVPFNRSESVWHFGVWFFAFSILISKKIKVKNFLASNFQQKPREKSCFSIKCSSFSFAKGHLNTCCCRNLFNSNLTLNLFFYKHTKNNLSAPSLPFPPRPKSFIYSQFSFEV